MAMITADPKDVPQVESFSFTPENLAKAKALMANYPPGRQASAVIALLDLAQRQQGWLPRVAMNEVARILDMAPIRVYEVATFYTMFNLQLVGKWFFQICTTTPCMLRGAKDLEAVLQKKIGPKNHVSKDGKFSWEEVECMGACGGAPMIAINEEYYENITADVVIAKLKAL